MSLITEAEAVVQKQLDAYNARDIDLFMTTWADDAQVFEHPAKLLADGAGEIRERHLVRFNEPNLFGKLINRIVIGNKVFDHEIVSRNFTEGTGTVEVIGVYEVIDYKIVRAWFIFGPQTLD